MKFGTSCVVVGCAGLLGCANMSIPGSSQLAAAKGEMASGQSQLNSATGQSGYSDKQSGINVQCVQNAGGRIRSILENYYPYFKQNGAAATEGLHGVWFARKDLEAARHYLVPDPENKVGWYTVVGQTCFKGDTEFPEYKQMQADFAKAEQEVKEMEAARGVTFKEVQNGNHAVYLDKDGNEVARPDHI